MKILQRSLNLRLNMSTKSKVLMNFITFLCIFTLFFLSSSFNIFAEEEIDEVAAAETSETAPDTEGESDKIISDGAAEDSQSDGTGVYPAPPPFIYQGLFPCQACHRKDIRGVNSQLEKGNSFLKTYIRLANSEPRVLTKMHRDIRLKHADWHWCLNCHSTYERNKLKLITGENISFEQSYRLCGQCHGTIFRDWKLGVHGRRVGQWDGKKLYLLCAHCHDPHKPMFRKLPGKKAPDTLDGELKKSDLHKEELDDLYEYSDEESHD